MVNLDEQRHEQLRKELKRSFWELVSHKHLVKGICDLWEKRHTTELNVLALILPVAFLLLEPEHAFWFKGRESEGERNRRKAVIQSYQRVRGSPEIQK